jgi:two-component system cell cycle response regulator DivK
MGAPERSDSAREPQRQQFPLPSPPFPPRRQPQRGTRTKIVLIADDVQDAREIYAAYFESRGFRTVTARDGESAVALTTSLKPDVVVMDLAMPRLDGIGATQRLKRDQRTRHIPVIVLTGYPDRAIQDGALDAGAAAFLTKPCLPEDLETTVRRVIDRSADPF